MDHFKKLHSQAARYLVLVGFISQLIAVGVFGGVLFLSGDIDDIFLAGTAAVVVGFVANLLLMAAATKYVLEPLSFVWRAIIHVSATADHGPPPNLDSLQMGRELVQSLVTQVYQFASQQDSSALIEHRKRLTVALNVVRHMPQPLFVFNKQQLVTSVSDVALTYCQLESAQLLGKPLYETLDLEFHTDNTLEKWIADCQDNKVTDVSYWRHVRVKLPGEEERYRQCDLVASYNRDNPSGAEFIVTLFDRTKEYQEEDDNLSFVALAVHELRTPLTLLKGYVEVFQEELNGKLTPELQDFMHKMQLSADHLSAFVNNILKVARVEENQLVLELSEANWETTLREVVNTQALRAQVLNKTLECHVEPGLPTVGIDRISISEVLNNLIDNALKYSGKEPKKIIISTRLKDGLVETTVQDFGVGIPAGVIPNLFERFYRNHRTKNQVGGTGLGLFLTKAIVTAHGGQVWVESKEGEGSTFGFSLLPYAQLAQEQKNSNNTDIVRSAHGWIKNHSMYRR